MFLLLILSNYSKKLMDKHPQDVTVNKTTNTAGIFEFGEAGISIGNAFDILDSLWQNLEAG